LDINHGHGAAELKQRDQLEQESGGGLAPGERVVASFFWTDAEVAVRGYASQIEAALGVCALERSF